MDKKTTPSPPPGEKLFIDINRAKTLAPAGATRFLQIYYSVPEGCPHCGIQMLLTSSGQQQSGVENVQVSNCPECKASLVFVIGKYLPSGKFKPADLKYLKPDGDVMKAFATDMKVLIIDPKTLTNPTPTNHA